MQLGPGIIINHGIRIPIDWTKPVSRKVSFRGWGGFFRLPTKNQGR